MTRVGAPPVADLYARLLDDAAVFPPGNAPMGAALSAYARTQETADAPYLGAFVCSNRRLDELLAALPDELPVVDLSLVVPAGAAALPAALAQVEASPRIVLHAVELPAAPAGLAATLAALDGLPPGVLAYVELPLDGELASAAAAVGVAGHRVKLRTGGTTAEAFPSEQALAAGLAACLRAGVPFKLTAGLHDAVRHRDPRTGFEHHGFLNVLVALADAVEGPVDETALASTLAAQDGAALALAADRLPREVVAAVRRRFVGFGTCSTADPLADLRALGLVPTGRR